MYENTGRIVFFKASKQFNFHMCQEQSVGFWSLNGKKTIIARDCVRSLVLLVLLQLSDKAP